MNYQGFDYTVVQTANPTGWKWTVPLAGKRPKTGDCFRRETAIAAALCAIDKALQSGTPDAVSYKIIDGRMIPKRAV